MPTGRSLWALGRPGHHFSGGNLWRRCSSPDRVPPPSPASMPVLVTTCSYSASSTGATSSIASASTVLFTGQIPHHRGVCAGVFAWLLTVNQVPATITAWLQSLNVSAWMLLLAINILLLVVGCCPRSAVGDPAAQPASWCRWVKAVGINTVHFGIVVTVNLAIGLFHPPFGINIFVAAVRARAQTRNDHIAASYPSCIIYLIALALDYVYPGHIADRGQVSAGQRLIQKRQGG